MATNMPPHNPSEVIDGIIAFMDNPEISTKGLMKYILYFNNNTYSFFRRLIPYIIYFIKYFVLG